MQNFYNPLIFISLLVVLLYAGRKANAFFYKDTVKRAFRDIMKMGFGVESSLKVIKGLHGDEGVEIAKQSMLIPNCKHTRLSNREIHDFDPGKLKHALEHFPQADIGPTKQKPCYCVACGKLFTNLDDFKSKP